MTPGKIRANKSRSNTAYNNYGDTTDAGKGSETPWRTTVGGGSDHNFGVISETDEKNTNNEGKQYFWDYDGHRKLRMPPREIQQPSVSVF